MSRQGNYEKQALRTRAVGGRAAVMDMPAGLGANGGHRSEQAEDRRVLDEIMRLVEASRAGRLSERGRAEHFDGDDRKLVEGVNTMLDAILLPIIHEIMMDAAKGSARR